MTLADRLIVMNEGRFEQIGTPIQVYEQPATTFVAGFIGSPAMNFLEVQPAEEPHRLLLSGNVTLELESEHRNLLEYAGKTVPSESIAGPSACREIIRRLRRVIAPRTGGDF